MKKSDNTAGVILAGGKSSRFGRDKTLLEVNGMPIIERLILVLSEVFNEIIIVGKWSRPVLDHVEVVKDIIPDKGPLGGVYTALMHSPFPRVFVAACDMPFLKTKTVKAITDEKGKYDIIVPRDGKGLHPLCAVYSKYCIKTIKENLDKDILAIHKIFDNLKTRIVTIDNDSESFVNVNRPEEYEDIKRQIRQAD